MRGGAEIRKGEMKYERKKLRCNCLYVKIVLLVIEERKKK